ncbi:hypothetical protein FIBSPDRAFT_393828, partial [Athelia psychrophila]
PLEALRPLWTSLCSQSALEKLALYWINPYPNARTSGRSMFKLPSPNVVHILEDLKQLRVLEVPQPELMFISADFLERFSQLGPAGAPILGPNLQTFLFHHSSYIDFQSFARTLQSRFPPGSEVTLKTVTILYPHCDIVARREMYQKSAWWDQIRDVGINVRLQASYAVWW